MVSGNDRTILEVFGRTNFGFLGENGFHGHVDERLSEGTPDEMLSKFTERVSFISPIFVYEKAAEVHTA